MKRIRFVGDIHGDAGRKSLMTPYSIQLGDLRLDYRRFGFTDNCGPRFFVDGNHENFPCLDTDMEMPYEVVPNLLHIPRGYISGETMFIGGGHSIDRSRRTPGYDWYPDEVLTGCQFHKIMSVKPEKVTTIISHDCPTFVMEWLVHNRSKDRHPHQHQDALAMIFHRFQPKTWIFAHYHLSFYKEIHGCLFRCLKINETMEIGIPLGDEWPSYTGLRRENIVPF